MWKLLVLSLLVALVSGRPQEIASPDEVELVDPVNTNNGDPEQTEGGRDPVVLVVRVPNIFGGNNEDDGQAGGFPFGGGFDLPSLGDDGFSGLFPRPNGPRVQSPFDIFHDILTSGPRDDTVEEGDVEIIPPVEVDNGHRGCGLICNIFGLLGTLQGEIDGINDEMHNGGGGFPGLGGFGGFGGFDNFIPKPSFGTPEVNNATYEEKVLDDGTVVGINRTTFSDTDENGNTFFFQTTFTQNINPANQQPDYAGEEEYTVDALPPLDDPVEEDNTEVQYDNTEAQYDLPEDDPEANEIPDGVDSGLKNE